MKKYSAIGNSKNEAVVEPLLEVKQSYRISIQKQASQHRGTTNSLWQDLQLMNKATLSSSASLRAGKHCISCIPAGAVFAVPYAGYGTVL